MSATDDDSIMASSHGGERLPSFIKQEAGKGIRDWVLHIITPSILTRTSRQPPTSKSYLDGLRGFAALLVYIQHHQVIARLGFPENSTDIFSNAYGYNNQHYFACLPFIRIFFSGGHFAAATFYVISGYVLSVKPLQLIYRKEVGALGDLLASSLFRRWMRLWLPVILTTVGYATTLHIFGIWTTFPKRADTYRRELLIWYYFFKNFSFLLNQRSGESDLFPYNTHLWSIPVEFRGSIVIFTSLLALSRCTKGRRLWYAVVLICYFLYYIVDDGSPFYAMFVSGFLICQLDLLSTEGALPSLVTRIGENVHKRFSFWGLFLLSLYLGGVPTFSPDLEVLKVSPGWHSLLFLSPTSTDYKWYYLFFASSLLVLSVPRLPLVRWFFEGRFCQYLGQISFALYLVHGPVLWTLGDRLYLAVGWIREEHVEGMKDWMNLWPMSKKGPLGLEPAFLIPHLMLLPFTLWLAEVVTRLCDAPSVRFPRWLYEKSIRPPGDI